MPRIAYITSTFLDYQKCHTVRYTGQLAKALSEQGHEVHVITSAIPEIRPTYGRIQIHKIMQHWSPRDLPRLIQTLSQIKPDLIHISHPTALAVGKTKLLMPILPEVIRTTMGTPIITTIHDFNSLGLIDRWKTIPMAISSNEVTVTNERCYLALKNSLPKRFHSKIHIVNLGTSMDANLAPMDPLAQRQLWDLKASDKVIGFLGFITPPKGFHNLVDACIPLLKENPNYKVLAISSWNLAQPSYRQSILDKIEKNHLQSQFIFTGYLKDDELWNALYAVDVCVFPFDQPVEDHSSASLRQALFHGRPAVVYADDLKYSEFGFKHGENIWFTKRGDTSQLQMDIIRLLENPVLQKVISQGTQSLRSTFGIDSVSNEFSRLYSNLINRGFIN